MKTYNRDLTKHSVFKKLNSISGPPNGKKGGIG
jgi:hypothetical protein